MTAQTTTNTLILEVNAYVKYARMLHRYLFANSVLCLFVLYYFNNLFLSFFFLFFLYLYKHVCECV